MSLAKKSSGSIKVERNFDMLSMEMNIRTVLNILVLHSPHQYKVVHIELITAPELEASHFINPDARDYFEDFGCFMDDEFLALRKNYSLLEGTLGIVADCYYSKLAKIVGCCFGLFPVKNAPGLASQDHFCRISSNS